MAKMIYEWREGVRLAGSADVVGRTLDRIRKKHGLTAENVIAEARHPGNVLHEYFEWNNGKAAEKYRKHQARNLILSIVRIDIDDDAPPVRAFVKLSDETEYEPIREVLSDAERRIRLLKDVKVRIKGLKELLSAYEDCADIINHLSKAEHAAAQKVVVAKRSGRHV